MKDIEKDRRERRKVRARTKQAATTAGPSSSTPAAAAAAAPTADVEMTDVSAAAGTEEGKGKEAVRDGELEDESVYRKKEAEELAQLINEDVKKDIGASTTGLYELVGESMNPLYMT